MKMNLSALYQRNITEAIARGGLQGGAPDAPPPATPPATPPPSGDDAKVAAEKLAKIEAENAKLKKAADDAKKKEEELAAEALRKKAADDGKLAETLAETQKKLKDAEDERERLLAAARTRTEAVVAKLPEAEKARLARLKDKLTFADWQEEVDAAAASLTTSPTTPPKGGNMIPPSTGTTGSPVKDRGTSGQYEPTPEATEILAKMGKSDAVLRTLAVEKDEASGSWKIFKPVEAFIKDMPRKMVTKLSHEEAAKRKLMGDNQK